MNWDKIVDELLSRPTTDTWVKVVDELKYYPSTVTSDMQSASVRVTGLYAVPKKKSLGELQELALCSPAERKALFPYCVF